ncbi:hypothetical protein ZHAS_00006173 [Anopheles sinensis]|uniref:Uncharacterized protein n=1 Tax=Anopheles sinensis TaxID=74873 RepID=A0A084VLC7_ANOSI|nr:hypothetical protein ZHAS_00006173 [Anopheles sinensis]
MTMCGALRRLHAKVLQEKRTVDEEARDNGSEPVPSLPENVPPKAAALLMEGFCRSTTVQSSLKVHRRPPTDAVTPLTRSHSVRDKENRPEDISSGQQLKLTVVRKQQTTFATPSATDPAIICGTPTPEQEQQGHLPVVQERPTVTESGHQQQQRPTSLTVTRTATIRKGSVWANNSTSKDFFRPGFTVFLYGVV